MLSFSRPPSEWRLFSWRPDSSLALSLIYEVGPRSRVWIYDIDVTFSGGRILWGHHRGFLNDTKGTLTVLKEYVSERTLWRFVRNRAGDSLMTKLHAYVGDPYVYKVPETQNDGWICADASETGIDEGNDR